MSYKPPTATKSEIRQKVRKRLDNDEGKILSVDRVYRELIRAEKSLSELSMYCIWHTVDDIAREIIRHDKPASFSGGGGEPVPTPSAGESTPSDRKRGAFSFSGERMLMEEFLSSGFKLRYARAKELRAEAAFRRQQARGELVNAMYYELIAVELEKYGERFQVGDKVTEAQLREFAATARDAA